MGKVLSNLCFPVHVDIPTPHSEVKAKEEKKVLKGTEGELEEAKQNYSEDSFYLITHCEGISGLLDRY
jgi:hypothetical protein